MVARGELGEIIHVQGHFFQDWLLHATDYNWRVMSSEGGKLRAVAAIECGRCEMYVTLWTRHSVDFVIVID